MEESRDWWNTIGVEKTGINRRKERNKTEVGSSRLDPWSKVLSVGPVVWFLLS